MKAVPKRRQLPARDTATAVTVNSTEHHELSRRIAALNGLTAQQLRDEWRRLYRGQPPRLSRDLLIRTFRAWGSFHSGCWWLGRLLSWALLGRILNGTDEPPPRSCSARQRLYQLICQLPQ
jgi:hypothetical protein